MPIWQFIRSMRIEVHSNIGFWVLQPGVQVSPSLYRIWNLYPKVTSEWDEFSDTHFIRITLTWFIIHVFLGETGLYACKLFVVRSMHQEQKWAGNQSSCSCLQGFYQALISWRFFVYISRWNCYQSCLEVTWPSSLTLKCCQMSCLQCITHVQHLLKEKVFKAYEVTHWR